MTSSMATSATMCSYDHRVDPTTQALLLVLFGAVLVAGVVLAWWVSEQQRRAPDHAVAPEVPAGVDAVLSVLKSSALVVNDDDQVLKASAPAYALGLVRGKELSVAELADLVRAVRRDGQIREAEIVLSGERATAPVHVMARVAPLGSRLVLALLEDRTRERRVEAVRRDFVANVSHELKTPVGAINVLAEAVTEAAEDPEAVRRFAGRMQVESARLTGLIQRIIELSRLQGDDPIDAPHPIAVDDIIDRAIDQSTTDAQARNIVMVRHGSRGLEVLGNGDQVGARGRQPDRQRGGLLPGRLEVVVSARG